MKNVKGFSIIEILIYLLISSLISIFIGYLILDLYKNTKIIYKNFDEYIQMSVAFNKITNDLKSLDMNNIKKIDANHFRFKEHIKDVAFEIDDKKRLVKSCERSVILSNNVKNIKFVPDFYQNKLVGVFCFIEKNNFQISRYISFKKS
ncbi:prepilin-type N-terminal cleavage/methylation domain-containing protein [Candidatus Dependentiae bacterium]|nr:prepilin-type N-terminal cleavage/methylation domain-containing protein [Candidatus Dependentiae bacterium]